jgi:hypothetical protein
MRRAAKRNFLFFLMTVGGLGCAGAITLLFCASEFDGLGVALLWGTITGFCILCMFSASTAVEHRWWRWIAFAGVPLMMIGMICLLFVLTVEILRDMSSFRFSQTTWTVVSSIYFGGALLCIASAIGALRLTSFARLLQALTLIGLLATFTVLEALFANPGNHRVMDIFFTILLIAGLLTFTTLFLYRVTGLKEPDPLTAFDLTLHLRCPRCRTEQDLPTGEAHCIACHLRFHIDMEDPVCLSCGYNLRGLLVPKCPECGRTTLAPLEVPQGTASTS